MASTNTFPETTESRHSRSLIEYRKKQEIKKSMHTALLKGENILVGVLGPPNSGKTTEAHELQDEFSSLMKEAYGDQTPDPTLLVTYELGESAAKKYLLEQSVADTKIYENSQVVFDQRSELEHKKEALKNQRDAAVGPIVEAESNIDLIQQMLAAFRIIQSDPAKRVLEFDGPGNGYALEEHNYARDMMEFIITQRHYKAVAPSIKSIFLIYKLGNTAMYTKAPYERDTKIYQQHEEGSAPWEKTGYGGASAKRVQELLDEEVFIIDRETGQRRKGTYPEYIVQQALLYPESQKKAAQRNIQKVLGNPTEFSKALQQLDKIRIKGELMQMVLRAPKDYRNIHVFFDFVRYKPSRK